MCASRTSRSRASRAPACALSTPASSRRARGNTSTREARGQVASFARSELELRSSSMLELDLLSSKTLKTSISSSLIRVELRLSFFFRALARVFLNFQKFSEISEFLNFFASLRSADLHLSLVMGS